MNDALAGDALLYALAGLRVTALFVSAPMWGHSALPVRIRVACAWVVTLALFATVSANATAPLEDLYAIFMAALIEIAIGLALGFGTRLVFGGIALLGEAISIQGGLGAATVLDPTSGTSSVALASLFQTIALLVFLAIGGPTLLLGALAESFARWPIGGALSPALLAEGLIASGAFLFEIAVRLAAPITVVMWVANLGVGILGRFVPQLNLMMLQLPANIMIVLAMILAGSSLLLEGFARALTDGLARSTAFSAAGF